MAHVVDILRSVGAESLSPDVTGLGDPVVAPVLERIESFIQDSNVGVLFTCLFCTEEMIMLTKRIYYLSRHKYIIQLRTTETNLIDS